MTDISAIVFSAGAVTLAGIASHAFHSWLAQRERERLTATDKAELLKRFSEVESKILALRNEQPARRA